MPCNPSLTMIIDTGRVSMRRALCRAEIKGWQRNRRHKAKTTAGECGQRLLRRLRYPRHRWRRVAGPGPIARRWTDPDAARGMDDSAI